MAIRGGYMPKVLRVDLSARTVRDEALPDEAILRKVVGGTGLALHYLLKETTAASKPTDPATPLIFMTGPLAGTPAPSSSNYVVVSLHFDVPYAAGTGHSHGFWAARLKHAGYEGIIVTGRADSPVYLWIEDGRVEIRDAEAVWGQDTRETERLIKRQLGGEEGEISVACIGPAGEAMLHGASIKNDRNHGAGKGSPGAVMGAKRLKAIAVRGKGRVPLARASAFLDTVTTWERNLFVQPKGGTIPVGGLVQNAGITRHYNLLGELSLIASKNLSDPAWGKVYGNGYVEGCAEWIVEPKPSYNCKIACAYDVQMTSGPFAGCTASLCGGGENTEGAAGLIGVEDPGAAVAMTDFYDAMGLESANTGALVAAAFEAYARGLITAKDTEGLELRWGNYQAAMDLVGQMIRHEGFGGRLAAGGLKNVASTLAPAAREFALHIKGTGYNMHDWRVAWSVLLGQVISGAGPAWQAPGVDAFSTEPDLGYLAHPPGTTAEGKPEAVRLTQLKKLWEDCLGVCWFACWGVQDVTRLAPAALGQAVGWEGFDAAEAVAVGERVVNMMRLLYVRRGFVKADEFDVSPRLLEAPASGAAAGRSIAPHLPAMVDRYYELMGWDTATGRPRAETVTRLGLEAYAG
ncbi:MAG: hypothetical protein HYY35_04245 [Deltaproteobacteria bacterium]|nr:hypothetical protein [Deltaproteobacteria bacterium]